MIRKRGGCTGTPELARCSGGEKLAHTADRITETLLELGRRHPGQIVAAVTHGVMIRLAAPRCERRSSLDRRIATGWSLVHVAADVRADDAGRSLGDRPPRCAAAA